MRILLTADSAGGIRLEVDGNQLGSGPGLALPVAPTTPFRGVGVREQPQADSGTATSNLYGMTDDELLDCLGPSWRAMSDEQRRVYPRRDYHVFLARRAS